MKKYQSVLRHALTLSVILVLVSPSLGYAYEAAPVANTKNPTFITEKSVTMNGSVNPNEISDTYAWFEWGISGRSDVYETTHRQVWGGNTLSNFSDSVYGLAPNVQYFYRQIAESSRGRDVGITTYFTTKQLAQSIDPIVIIQTQSAINVLEKSATLRGYIAPHQGKLVRWWFEYGTTNRLENKTQVGSWGTDSGVAQLNVVNLTPGTAYLYRIAAENTQGIVYGVTLRFTTSGVAPLPGEAPRAQTVASPQAGDGISRSSGVGSTQAGGGGFTTGYSSAPGGGNVIPGSAYYPVSALSFPTFNFSSLFGGNKTATNNTSSGSSQAQAGASSNGKSVTNSGATQGANQVASAGGSTPLGMFWNTLTGKKTSAVSIEKIGPSSAPAHTPVEYRITYTYRRTNPATNAKLKIILPGSVVYIGDNTTNELMLEEGSGPERTYVLPIGRLESASTRTISILGMTTSDALGAFPDARARLEYTLGTGEVEVVSAEGSMSAQGAAMQASTPSSFSLFPDSFLGWLIYIALVTLVIYGLRKVRAYYLAKKEEVALEEESQRREGGSKQLPSSALPA